MPVNEVADKVHNFFEQDGLSRGRHQSQVPSGNWSSQHNLWVGNHRPGDSQLSPNVKTYGAHQSDSERVIGRGSPQVPVGTNPTHLTSRIEFANSQSINRQSSLNGFVPENQGFQTNQNQAAFEFFGEDTVSDKRSIMPGTLPVTESRQGNGTEYQSIMTRNLGLMETFEAPTKFGFLDGQQQLTRSQQLGMPQSQTRQHQGFNEMQLWQQNLRIKQLQGLQRQQQQFHLLEQAGRQRNQTNQPPPLIVKHAVREQLPDAVNGIPVHINLAQCGGSPAVQVSVNSPLLSRERGQVVRSVGLGNQQFGQSLYGTPVVSTRGAVNQFPYQGFSRYTDDMLNEAGENQVQRHMVSAAFDNSFHGNQSAVHQGQESQRREGPDGWSGNLDEQALTRIGPSQGSVSLDPTEREILFGTDENLWEAPLGGSGSMGTGSFGNSLGGTDCFPSLQSGRWSALMQSAVGEASSGDTRLQDEWNGFSCQSERSTGNLPATLDGVRKEQLNLVDTNMKTAPSIISRSSVMFDDANMGQNSSSIHGFPQQDKKLSFQQGVIVQRNGSYQSIRGWSEEAGQRYDQTAQQNQIEGTRQVQASMFVQNARERAQDGHIYGLSESSVHPAGTELNARKLRDSWVNRKSTPSYNIGDANSSEQKSWNTNDSPSQSGDAAAKNIPDNLSTMHLSQRCDQERRTHTEKDNDVGRWNISDNHMANSFRSSTGLRDSETPNAPSPQFQGNQLTSPQGFGLRLGPPSQGFPVPNKAFTPLNSSQMANNLNPRQVETEVGERSGMWSSSLQTSRPCGGMSQGGKQDDELDYSGQLRNGSLNMHKKFSAAYVSGAFYPRNVLQHKQMSSESGLDLPNHSFDRNPSHFKQQNDLHNGPLSGQFAAASLPGATTIPPFSYEPPADPSQPTKTNLLNARVSGLECAVMDAVTASQPNEMPGMTQQRAFSAQRSVWNSLPYQHELASGQPEKVLFQYKIPNNDPPTILSVTEMLDGQDVKKGSNGPSDYGTCSVNSQHSFADDPLEEKNSCQHKSSEQVDLTPQTSDASHGTAAVGVCALEQEDTKGRCGKDTELVSETNQGSLLTSVNNKKQIEAFGCSLKPLQGLQQNYSQLRQDQAVKCVETDPTQNDFKRFKGANCDLDVQGEVATAGKQLFDEYNAAARETADNEMNTAERHILFPSGEVPNTMSSFEPPIGDIPPQNRAIFSQQSYQIHSGLPSSTSGWSKYHQMASSVIEQHRTVNGQPQIYDTPETTRTDTEQFILGKASKSLHGDISTKQISNVSLTVVESKKRKSATLEILPWHKQVARGSRRLQSISMAEQDWVQAANRLIERLEHDTEMSEDGQLLLRSRRRLILTTRLMQQLLSPPSAAILSSDATSVYESATYVVAKLALGDACSLVSYSVNDSHVAPKKENRRSTRFENSKRPSNLYISEVVENFISRAKKLESDLLRLEKKPSILDIRVESRDQERFSVLNRFAKFHGGGNTNAASSSSTQKIRYVIACPMPRKVPQGVQCFPL